MFFRMFFGALAVVCAFGVLVIAIMAIVLASRGTLDRSWTIDLLLSAAAGIFLSLECARVARSR